MRAIILSMTTLYALLSVVAVSLISLIGIFALSFSTKVLNKGLFILVSLAVGALFGDAVIHLIPEIYNNDSVTPQTASLFILLGIFSFFILEKFLRWRHVHSIDLTKPTNEHSHKKPVGVLVIISDGIHNFLDGLIIGASYLVSIEVGVATTLAIILHEIPQEVGDFGLLLHAGFTKIRALFINFLSALTAILGTVFAITLLGTNAFFISVTTAFAAGSFLYIAGSDLIPELHKTSSMKNSILQLFAITAGVGSMWLLLFVE